VLELEGGRYLERATVVGDPAFTVTRPFPLTLVPSALLD